jgi:hypothetical protein
MDKVAYVTAVNINTVLGRLGRLKWFEHVTACRKKEIYVQVLMENLREKRLFEKPNHDQRTQFRNCFGGKTV